MSNQKDIATTVREYGKRLLGFIRNKVQTNEDAEDILQDVWFQLSNLTDIEELESMSGWLFQVARNKITDLYRKKKTLPLENNVPGKEEDEIFNFKEIFRSQDPSPEMEMFRELFWDELMIALEELPEKQMQVFVWNELEDKTLQEIAEETGDNLKTIISRKGYAVKHLRKRLDYLYKELNDK